MSDGVMLALSMMSVLSGQGTGPALMPLHSCPALDALLGQLHFHPVYRQPKYHKIVIRVSKKASNNDVIS